MTSNPRLRIALLGALEPDKPSHQATAAALDHAARALGAQARPVWLAEADLLREADGPGFLEGFQGVMAPPGKDYANPAGVWAAIRFCRERLRPFLGT